MTNVLIRADADTSTGIGHLMRCLALGAALRERGCHITFVSRCDSEPLRRRIRAEGHVLVTLDASHPDCADLATTVAEVTRVQADWLVADGYHFDEAFFTAACQTDARVLAMEDGVRLAYYHADVVLDQNVDATGNQYPAAPETRLLLGPKYALLRPEFRNIPGRQGAVPAIVRRLLVTLGGSDPHDVTGLVLDVVADDACDVDVVAGSANPHLSALRARVASARGNVRLYEDPGNMATLMAHADVAIAAAGSTTLELAAVGVPALLIVTAANQAPVASAMMRAGAARNLGWWGALTPAMLRTALEELSGDPVAREAQRRAGRALVDAEGATRVAAALLDGAPAPGNAEPALVLRPAGAADAASLWVLANASGVRANSLDPRPIPLDAHLDWYADKLRSPGTRIWLLVDGARLAAQIRYDRVEPDLAEISIAVATRRRGAGLGTRLLSETWARACSELEVERVRGIVLKDNVASARAFMKADFREADGVVRSGQICRVFVRTVKDSTGMTARRNGDIDVGSTGHRP